MAWFSMAAVFGNVKIWRFYLFDNWEPKYIKQIILLYRDDSYVIKNIKTFMHGDKRPNGECGSHRNLNKIDVKSFVGHSHSLGIFGGCWQVGTSFLVRMGYNSGPSSWMHTHCVITRMDRGRSSTLWAENGALNSTAKSTNGRVPGSRPWRSNRHWCKWSRRTRFFTRECATPLRADCKKEGFQPSFFCPKFLPVDHRKVTRSHLPITVA